MTGLRVDKWMWFARFCKTRGVAQRLIDGGEMLLNGQAVGKASLTVKPGDEIVFPWGRGRRRVQVLGLAERRGPALEARLLYQDLEPPPEPVDDEWLL